MLLKNFKVKWLRADYLFAPETDVLDEVKIGIKTSKVILKDEFFYDPDQL